MLGGPVLYQMCWWYIITQAVPLNSTFPSPCFANLPVGSTTRRSSWVDTTSFWSISNFIPKCTRIHKSWQPNSFFFSVYLLPHTYSDSKNFEIYFTSMTIIAKRKRASAFYHILFAWRNALICLLVAMVTRNNNEAVPATILIITKVCCTGW